MVIVFILFVDCQRTHAMGKINFPAVPDTIFRKAGGAIQKSSTGYEKECKHFFLVKQVSIFTTICNFQIFFPKWADFEFYCQNITVSRKHFSTPIL